MNPSHGPLRFVAEGRDSLRRELADRLRRELCGKHHRELAGSGFVAKMLLRWRIEREVRRAVDTAMPSQDAVHLRQE